MMTERERRLNQMLRVARSRMRRRGYSRRGRRLPSPHQKSGMLMSDFHIEIRRLLLSLGRADEAEAMEEKRRRRLGL